MSLGRLVSKTIWLYANQVILSIFGFVYWLVISMLAGPSAVGVASAILSISTMVTLIICLGVPVSIQRYLGKALGEGDSESVRTFFWSAVCYAAVVSLGTSVIVLCLSALGLGTHRLRPDMLAFSAVLIALSSASYLNGILTACLETQYITYSSLASNVARLAVGVVLVLLGLGWVGVTLSLLAGSLASLLVLIASLLQVARKYELGGRPSVSLAAILELIKGGVPGWAPGLLLTLGQWFGVLSVYEIKGGAASGQYYIAFAICGVLTSFSTALLQLAMPMLSGMSRGRGELLRRATRVSLAIAGLASSALFFYSEVPLAILGRGYLSARLALSVLALSIVPATLVMAVNSFTYACGMYVAVLALGMAMNVPRLALYIPLVGAYGATGAALSYLLGSLTGLAAAAVIAARTKVPVPWGRAAIAITVSFTIFQAVSLLGAPWLVTLPLAAGATALAYARLRLVTPGDVREIARSVIPEGCLRRAYPVVEPMFKVFFGAE